MVTYQNQGRNKKKKSEKNEIKGNKKKGIIS